VLVPVLLKPPLLPPLELLAGIELSFVLTGLSQVVPELPLLLDEDTLLDKLIVLLFVVAEELFVLGL
jgi:hypothetical protein